jgi:hypothetical protein
MLLPVLTNEVRKQAEAELAEYSNPAKFCGVMFERLQEDNTVLADFLFDLTKQYQSEDWILSGMMFAGMVYRMIELQLGGTVPVIDGEIGRPLQAEFFQDPNKSSHELKMRILHQNPVVLHMATGFIWAFIDDERAISMLCFCGFMMYRFIEAQLEGVATKDLVPQ